MNICGDNRFELIERYKKQLVESTNIESSPDEMAVIDNILFRFWQMGWLKEQEPKQVIGIADSIEGMEVGYCPSCDRAIVNKKIDETKFCKYCGQAVRWHV